MKHKVTYNISTDNVQRLEGAWLEMRAKTKNDRLNKSNIVDKLIEYLAHELQHKGFESKFVRDLVYFIELRDEVEEII